jgi:hypothetical protein
VLIDPQKRPPPGLAPTAEGRPVRDRDRHEDPARKRLLADTVHVLPAHETRGGQRGDRQRRRQAGHDYPDDGEPPPLPCWRADDDALALLDGHTPSPHRPGRMSRDHVDMTASGVAAQMHDRFGRDWTARAPE